MSCFAGFYNFDQKPADPALLSAMAQSIARKGPDGGNDYCDGPLGMSYRAFHTTRESHWEVQPMVSRSGEVLCWDGRLDNREELYDLLGDHSATDADLVMAAYRKWGEDLLAHLIGDFALAIFDPRERQVLLGRDFFGPRPLFYFLQADRLTWSTDLLPLLRYTGADLALDEHYIAQFLVLSIEPHRTPYRNIGAVEPGHVMIFRDGQIKKNTWYWKPDPNKEIRYKTDGEYEEQFYALFRQSVKARLRSDDRPVWADLSGGLDSSSIVCMADEIMASEPVDCPRLDTWTAVNGESILTNELPYVKLVEDKRGQTGFHLYQDDLWFKHILRDEYQQPFPNALLCIPERTARLNARMESAGARVLLCGHGGDHVLGNSGISDEMADLMRGLRFRQLHDHLKTWSKATNQPYVKLFVEHALQPLLPAKLQSYRETNRPLIESLPEHTRQRLPRRAFDSYLDSPLGKTSPSRRQRVRQLIGAIRFLASGIHPEFSSFEVRHPYLDRLLAQWLLSVPSFQIQRPGETRSLMRRTFRNLLPSGIWERRTKGTVDEGICRGLNNAWSTIEELLFDSRLSRSGYFRNEYLESALQTVAHGGSTNRLVLVRILMLELWLRTLERRIICSQAAVAPLFSLSTRAFAKVSSAAE